MPFSQPYRSERADPARVAETRRDCFKLILLMVLSLLPTVALSAWVEAESAIARTVPKATYISAINASPHRAMTVAAESVQPPRMIRVRRLKPFQHRSAMMAPSAPDWAHLERVMQTSMMTFVSSVPMQPVVFDGHHSLPPPMKSDGPERMLRLSEGLNPESLTARAGSSAPGTRSSAATDRAHCAPSTPSQIPACTRS
jgi:hypothetical protein